MKEQKKSSWGAVLVSFLKEFLLNSFEAPGHLYYDENFYLQPVSGQHRGKQKEGSILRKDRCQSWECPSCTTYLFSNLP